MYEHLIEKKIFSEEIFNGKLLHVFRDKVCLPNGKETIREYIQHNGAVAVVPLFEDGTVLVERQFRYPFDSVMLEIPAGKIDPGENPLTAAERELREETGYVNAKFTPIGEFLPSVAYTTEVIYLYIATGMTDSGVRELDDNEFLDTERIPLTELVNMVMNGKIRDSKTQTAILKTYLLESAK